MCLAPMGSWVKVCIPTSILQIMDVLQLVQRFASGLTEFPQQTLQTQEIHETALLQMHREQGLTHLLSY